MKIMHNDARSWTIWRKIQYKMAHSQSVNLYVFFLIEKMRKDLVVEPILDKGDNLFALKNKLPFVEFESI